MEVPHHQVFDRACGQRRCLAAMPAPLLRLAADIVAIGAGPFAGLAAGLWLVILLYLCVE